MVNYSNSIIYKLCCKDPEIKEIYVGSTTNFYRRKQKHKSICNNSNDKSYNFNVYEFIRNNGGFDNWEMIEIEKYKCNDKNELRARERYFLEQLGASLNMRIPSRTIEEKKENRKKYREENQDKNKEYFKKYREENQDKIKEYQKENQDKIKEYFKKYYQENQDKVKENIKKYQKENQDKLKEYHKKYSSKKINCELCNKEMNKSSLNRHKKNIHNI